MNKSNWKQRCGQCDFVTRGEDKIFKHLAKEHNIHIGNY